MEVHTGYQVLFLTQQIGISIVSLLTDQELIKLGIKTVGDRAMLRKHCRESVQSKWILNIACIMVCKF